MTWKQLTERDCREWKLSVMNPHDRHTWRSDVRSAMGAASQLPGRVVKMVDRRLNVLLNTINIFQDVSSFSALIPCAWGFVSPAILCYFINFHERRFCDTINITTVIVLKKAL